MKTFKPRICKICGREYIPIGPSQEYCGSYKLKTGCSYKMFLKSQKLYHQIHKKEVARRSKLFRENNREKRKIYLQLHKEERREQRRLHYQAHKEEKKAYQKLPKCRLATYKFNAKKNKREWSLTDNEFYELLKQPCYYTGRTDEMGVDRVNNSIGYTKENSVPCCASINYMKRAMSKDEFFQLCKEVVIHNHLL